MVLPVVSSAKLVFRSESSIETISPPKRVRHFDRRSNDAKVSSNLDDHWKAILVSLQSRLTHVIDINHDLIIGDGLMKYIRIRRSKTDVKIYPDATPIYKMIGTMTT